MAADVATTVVVPEVGNTSNESISVAVMPTVEAVSYSLILSTLIAATIVGNVLVILSVFTYAPLKTIPNFFVASLAGADLAVAVLVMPFHIANFVQSRWSFGAVWCNAWLTFDILTCTASILHLCAIALDRYYAIHDPINYAMQRTRRRVLVKIAVVWATSAVISVPPLIGWNSGTGGQHSLYNAESEQCQLTDDRGFVLYSASGSFYIPLAIMTVVYVRIFLATRARLRARSSTAAKYLRPTTTAASTATMCVNRAITGENGKAATMNLSVAVVEDRATTADVPDAMHEERSNVDITPTTEVQCTQDINRAPGGDECAALTCENMAVSAVAGSSRQELSEPAVAAETPAVKQARRKQRTKGGGTKSAPVNRQLYEFMEEKQRISLSKERRAARTMVIIMGAFVICWLPFFLMYVIFPFCGHCAESTDYRIVNAIVWLGYVNSTLNPIIYTVFNIDFRRAFKNLLTARCHRSQR